MAEQDVWFKLVGGMNTQAAKVKCIPNDTDIADLKKLIISEIPVLKEIGAALLTIKTSAGVPCDPGALVFNYTSTNTSRTPFIVTVPPLPNTGIGQQFQNMSLKAEKSCSIHCWQNMKVSGIFKYYEETVTFTDLLRWIKGTFGNVIDYRIISNLKVYYMKTLNDVKVRITIDTELRQKLYLVESDATQMSFIIVSVEADSPLTSPNVDAVSIHSSNISGLSGSSRGSVQVNFHDRVLNRDGLCCVFCRGNNKAHLKAAHIFDVFRGNDIPEDDKNFLRQFEITDLYDTDNGITLCSDCHFAFDALLCCVDVVKENENVRYKVKVADALKFSPEYGAKWLPLDGSDVLVPSEAFLFKHWPPDTLFNFRKAKFEEYKILRHADAAERPFVCDKCGKRTKSAQGLANHIQSKTCLKAQISTSTSYAGLHTPINKTVLQTPIKMTSYLPQSNQKANKKNRKQNNRKQNNKIKSPVSDDE